MKNTQNSYGLLSILFHWVNGLLVICLLGIGLFITTMEKGPAKLQMVGLHKSFGAIALFVIVARLLWMLVSPPPQLSAALPYLQKKAAKALHITLLFLITAMPLSGWLMSSGAGYPVSVFGLFNLPALVEKNKAIAGFMHETHETLGLVTIAVLVAHIGAGLYHHFIVKDNTLLRMLKPGA